MIQHAAVALAIVAICTMAGGAAAQSPAPATPDGVLKPGCRKPAWPGRLASEIQRGEFTRDRDAYTECVRKFVAEQQRLANAHADAANAAIADYNKFVEVLNAEMAPK